MISAEEKAKETKEIKNPKRKNSSAALNAALIAVMTAITAICSYITIPVGPVPFTLQTFAVFCAAGMLGAKRGTLSVIVYLLLGLIGAPVFSSFKSGPAVLFGPTGGYLIGFIFLSLIAGIVIDKFGSKWYIMMTGMTIGLAVDYFLGTAWFIIQQNGAVTVSEAFEKCVLLFIISDLVKMAAAIVISIQVRKRVKFLNVDGRRAIRTAEGE